MYPDNNRINNRPPEPPRQNFNPQATRPPYPISNYNSYSTPKPSQNNYSQPKGMPSTPYNYKYSSQAENVHTNMSQQTHFYSQKNFKEYHLDPYPFRDNVLSNEPLTVKWRGPYDYDSRGSNPGNKYARNQGQDKRRSYDVLISDDEAGGNSDESIEFDDDKNIINDKGPKYSQKMLEDDKIKKTNKNFMKENLSEETIDKQDQLNTLLKLVKERLPSIQKVDTQPKKISIQQSFNNRVEEHLAKQLNNSSNSTPNSLTSAQTKATPTEDLSNPNKIDLPKPPQPEQKNFSEKFFAQPQQIENIQPKNFSNSRNNNFDGNNSQNFSDFSSQNRPRPNYNQNGYPEKNWAGQKQYRPKPDLQSEFCQVKQEPPGIGENQPYSNSRVQENGLQQNRIEISLPDGLNINEILEKAKSINQNNNTQTAPQTPVYAGNGTYNNNGYNTPQMVYSSLNQNGNNYNNNNNYGNNYNNNYNNNNYSHRKKYSTYNEEDNYNRNPNYRGNRDYNNRDRNRYPPNNYNSSYKKDYPKKYNNNYFPTKTEDYNFDRKSEDYSKLLVTPINEFKSRPPRGKVEYHERASSNEKAREPGQLNELNAFDLLGNTELEEGMSSPITNIYKTLIADSGKLFENIRTGLDRMEFRLKFDEEKFKNLNEKNS